MDFTKIRGNKKERFDVGDLVVCVVSKQPYTGVTADGDPGWVFQMNDTTGKVMKVHEVYFAQDRYPVCRTDEGHWYKPEWLIQAYDPENTLRLGEPVMYRYGKKAYVRTVRAIVGSYCELDNGAVFHHSKLFNLARAFPFNKWPIFWRDGLGLDGEYNQELCLIFRDKAREFNRSPDNYNLAA